MIIFNKAEKIAALEVRARRVRSLILSGFIDAKKGQYKLNRINNRLNEFKAKNK